MNIPEAMTAGASRYADALNELSRYGQAEFTQTGGMCATLEVRLERGYLLVTDVEDSLPWERADLCGWSIGFYWSDDAGEGPTVFVDRKDADPAVLGELVAECLAQVQASLPTRTRDT